ncbi:hypothetical protein RRG08_046280 [Elysia crispata]|uniref:Uncharacterized protein n=1 Tax=Elysia crispata TaxID=231223 RepID=A0AAE0YL95_9GAST|nr:hypothetical protein RRG08_046280 [Elysia crispata]
MFRESNLGSLLLSGIPMSLSTTTPLFLRPSTRPLSLIQLASSNKLQHMMRSTLLSPPFFPSPHTSYIKKLKYNPPSAPSQSQIKPPNSLRQNRFESIGPAVMKLTTVDGVTGHGSRMAGQTGWYLAQHPEHTAVHTVRPHLAARLGWCDVNNLIKS